MRQKHSIPGSTANTNAVKANASGPAEIWTAVLDRAAAGPRCWNTISRTIARNASKMTACIRLRGRTIVPNNIWVRIVAEWSLLIQPTLTPRMLAPDSPDGVNSVEYQTTARPSARRVNPPNRRPAAA
jgi:hypothetical protein